MLLLSYYISVLEGGDKYEGAVSDKAGLQER